MLLNLAGPGTLAVEPFLFNLFSDPDVPQLPLGYLYQPALARRSIPPCASTRRVRGFDGYHRADAFNDSSKLIEALAGSVATGSWPQRAALRRLGGLVCLPTRRRLDLSDRARG